MKTRGQLREAQLTAVADLTGWQQRMLLAGMGAGKTVSILTAFKDLKDEGFVSGGIILAPPRVVDLVWPRECAKWDHLQGLKVVAVRGTPKQREAILRGDADLFAVSIDSLKWLTDVMATLPKDDRRRGVLAIDEISKLRDPRSKLVRYGMTNGLFGGFDTIWGATGTIKPNGYEDLWNTYRIISQGQIWDGQSFDEWRREQFMPLDHKGYSWRVHRFAKKDIDRKVAAFTTAVEADLGLEALNIGDEWDIEVALDPDAQAAYDEMTDHMLTELKYEGELDDRLVAAMSAAVQSGKQSQIAQGFVMDKVVDEAAEVATSRVVKNFSNAKMRALKEQVELLNEQGENVIICYYFKEDLRALRAVFPKAGHLGSGMSPKQAEATVDSWNAGRLQQVLAHPASVGHGIELQFGGRWMIWYTPTWSSEQFDQMVKRIHRPGQTRPVFIARVVALGTVDRIKTNRVSGKMDELRAFEAMLREWTNLRGEK